MIIYGQKKHSVERSYLRVNSSGKTYRYSGCSKTTRTNASLMGTTAANQNTNLLSEHQNAIPPYMPPHCLNQEFHRPRGNRAVLTLDSLSRTPQEILATEHQLRLPQPAPLVGVPSKENLNRYCDYHNEKGHSTNDYFHLKQQLEIALESGKLNHLVKDVRQRGITRQRNNGPQKAKIINIV
ncbi:hypothetical protein Tco_0704732 [Tanacetum coccineum]|uniref:Uncharacterized protein n=1 Tax=Tanacetum coccineum TaxID=301880 RepID=A0ABQ4Y2T7_9ASTR